RDRARNARQKVDSMQIQDGVLGDVEVESIFIGYDYLQADTTILEMIVDKDIADSASEGQEAFLILGETPFYAESGGQIADKGTISCDSGEAEVQDVQKAPNGQHLHRVIVREGRLKKDQLIRAKVEATSRKAIVKNHTATH